MVFKRILLTSSLLGIAFTLPLSEEPTPTIQKRAATNTPSIAAGFSPVQTQQIMDAFQDAMELASYVRVSTADVVDPIFAKYFNDADRNTVNAVFDTILGGNAMDPPGNALLKDITIKPDYPDAQGNSVCSDAQTFGALRDTTKDNPSLVLCDPEGFGHGGIAKGYNDDGSDCDPKSDECNIDSVICTRFGPRASWLMTTLGAIILHEYTHWDKLMISPNGPLPKSTDDITRGIYETRQIDKTMATNNAESYENFATEVLWSVICKTTYEDPEPEDGDDENCGGNACSDGTMDDEEG